MYTRLIDSFHIRMFEFSEYNQHFITNIKCQPEAWIYVAACLAYFNLKKLHNNDISSLQFKGFTKELSEFFADLYSENKLRLAMESYQFHRQLTKQGYNIENILRAYEQLIVDDNHNIFDEKIKHNMRSFINHFELNEIIRPIINIKSSVANFSETRTTTKFKLHLIELNGPLVYGGFTCTYHLLGNGNIFFTICYQQEQQQKKKVNDNDLLLALPDNNNGKEVIEEFVEFFNQSLLHIKSIIKCC